ncbi:hypothetical protein TcasGA2_TC001557 [Tribolium castaneum]|uniref:Transcription factor IIIC 90kDa subunit N-terminal domain-containing protein n=1 Tax=Tribolium castaneum TaxID=7070 RepID=D6WFS3_TRICA|nr:PREDICTED: uncharacterized protein LOC103314831 [Tribolium castaneum]EEZ99572.2 hypothetical protein TcasGA2_TC001557 [Tribolium castaneum]|eukprot:XP_008200078.1 PREDICTED: uncharacterized protein LOC103314831 [Tribolium castaneum]
MSMQLKLLDHIQLNNHVYANFACDYSEDGKIFLLLENGVCILTLKGSVENVFPKFSFKKDLITLSDANICENLDIDLSSFLNDLTRHNLYEAILDVGLSGDGVNTTPTPPRPVQAMWSPRGVVEKTEGALAILTNLNNIEVYVEVIDENEISSFIRVANFSKDVTDYYRRSWKKVETPNADNILDELKRRVDLVAPTAFTWSHVILKDRKACCILFVGHRDGAITAWRFVERKASEIYESRLQFLERYNTKLGKITALHWFCRKSDAGGLSLGDVNGHIGALSVSKLSTDKIKFSDEVVFNSESDLKVDKLSIVNYQNITYMIAVKQNFFQIYAINCYGEVFGGKLIQVGNLYITGVLHYEKNVLLVLSLCGQLKQIELSVVDNEVCVTEKIIQLNIDTNKYRTHGFLFSPNKVFLGILAYPCQIKDISRGKNFVNFFVFGNKSKDPFQTLMNIRAPSIRDYWDCFETLRVNCLQEKVFPWKGIDRNLNYDTLPLLKLKILRWIAKLSEKIYPMISRVEEYHIKAYVLLNYAVDIKLAVQRMTKLLNIYFSEKKLSLFQMQSLDLLNFFLKEMVVKDVLTKANLGETFIDEIFNVVKIANELQYPPMPQCLWCGEKIIGSSCVPFHADSRCAISLMPLNLTPGYKCPFCKCVVSKEIDKEYYPIFCPYCDIPMKRRCFDRKYKKSTDDASETTKLEDIITSECSSDCLQENIHFSDIEENTVDYIVLTDSEDEKEDSVKELYSKILKLSVNTPEEFDQSASLSNTKKGQELDQGEKQTEAEDVDDEEEDEQIEEEGEDPADENYDGNADED